MTAAAILERGMPNDASLRHFFLLDKRRVRRGSREQTHTEHTNRLYESSVNPKSTSNQSSRPCTVLQYPSRWVFLYIYVCNAPPFFLHTCKISDIYINIHMYIHTYLLNYIRIYIHIYTYLYMYICISCIYICIYI